MKLTHVRISVLESGPGYNNSSCTLEAQVEDGEDWTEVANELRAMCKSHIKGMNEIERLWQHVNEKREELVRLERDTAYQRNMIDANRKIIRDHEKLGDIAKAQGIDNQLFDDSIPF